MLLSSSKFRGKAQEVLSSGLSEIPIYKKLEKNIDTLSYREVKLDGPDHGDGGMMLYTSGTTNKPVRLTGVRFV